MFNLILLILTYNIQKIDIITAKTTIRLWHELHVSKLIQHDFLQMISPETNGYYIGAIKYSEVRAIAHCFEKKNTQTVKQIAYAPDQLDAAIELLHYFNETGHFEFDWNYLQNQRILYYEGLYINDFK